MRIMNIPQLKSDFVTARNCAKKWAENYKLTHDPLLRELGRFATEQKRITGTVHKRITGRTI